jgi:hypothetical protein
MATISEDYVSYEVAKLLKEKGFEILTSKVYDNQKELDYQCTVCWQEERLPYVSAPTHQMTMKWLRETHSIAIEPMLLSHGWFCQIEKILEDFCKEYIDETDSYKTYEEAVEASIKYALENLI